MPRKTTKTWYAVRLPDCWKRVGFEHLDGSSPNMIYVFFKRSAAQKHMLKKFCYVNIKDAQKDGYKVVEFPPK